MSNRPDPQTLTTIYSLPPFLNVEKMEANVYHVGSHNGDYALKVYPHGVSLDGQRYEHWLLMALSSRPLSFAIPAPLRSQEGATFYTASNGTTWVLAPKLSGNAIQHNDPDQANAAGNALAELHTELATLPALPNPQYPDYHIQARTLPQTRGLLPTNPAEIGLQDTREASHRLHRFVELARTFQQEPPLPDDDILWHIVHGEFYGANLLYDGDRVVGVLDFETAHPDYRVREFAQTLMKIASDLGPIFWGAARSFSEGYREKLPLTRQEIELVPHFMAASLVEQVMAYWRSGQPVHAAQALRTQEEFSAWLESEQSRLLAMLRGTFLGE